MNVLVQWPQPPQNRTPPLTVHRCHTGLIQTEVPQGQREADPHGELDPDEHGGLEGVTVVPHVELRDDATQVLLKLEPEDKQLVSGPGLQPGLRLALFVLGPEGCFHRTHDDCCCFLPALGLGPVLLSGPD